MDRNENRLYLIGKKLELCMYESLVEWKSTEYFDSQALSARWNNLGTYSFKK